MNVELPDGTVLEDIPEGTTRAQIAAKLQAAGRTVPKEWLAPPAPPARPGAATLEAPLGAAVAEPVMAMGSAMIAKPASDVAGLVALGSEGLRRFVPGIPQVDPTAVKEGVQRAMTYEPRTAIGQTMTDYNPLALIGRGVGWMGDKAEELVSPSGSGPAQTALGHGVREAVTQAPGFLGLKAPVAATTAKDALRGGAEKLVSSSLKAPLTAGLRGDTATAIDYLLEKGINVSPGGINKMRGTLDTLNQQIADVIANNSGSVDKAAVGRYINPTIDSFMNQVAEWAPDVKAIQGVWDRFMQHPWIPGPDIPIQWAQEMKQGTYRGIGSKGYGEMKAAETEGSKSLARGLKEEIAKLAPEVKSLNREESRLIDALDLTERRVLMDANKNPAGLGWLTTSPEKFAAWMADRSPLFKSLVARMLNTGSKAVPSMEVAGPLAGIAISQEAAPPPNNRMMPMQNAQSPNSLSGMLAP